MLVFLLACEAPPGGAPPAAAPVPVKVATLQAEPLERVWIATGAIESERSVEIKPETSGQVVEVAFADGATVAAGQLLLRLRDADARASLADARARWDLAKLDLGRARTLFDRQDLSQADLDRALAQEALSKAAFDRAEEALRRTRVVAPFAGSVGKREVVEGAVVDPSRRITRLEDLAHLVVDVSLPERALGVVRPEQAASVQVDVGEPQAGRVSYVAPRVDANSRNVDVRVRLDAAGELRPGQTASVRIVTGRSEAALLVPTEAVVRSAKGASVYVLGADGSVALKPVRTGERKADKVELAEGVAAGDQVVIEGLLKLRPGAKVSVTP